MESSGWDGPDGPDGPTLIFVHLHAMYTVHILTFTLQRGPNEM